MTMIYADIGANAIFVDSAVTSSDGRRMRSGANKINSCGNGVLVMSGLFSAASLIAETLLKHYEANTSGKVIQCSVEFPAFGDDEYGDGFLLTPDRIYSVIHMHGRIIVTHASIASGDSAGSGQTWFNALRVCGHKPNDAFNLVLKHHADCSYPAYLVRMVDGRLRVEELPEDFQ